MKYADSGTILPGAAQFLDTDRTKFAKRVYRLTGHPVQGPMRELVVNKGGEWDCSYRPRGQFDTLNIPYKPPYRCGTLIVGTLIIERPWLDVQNCKLEGHRVSFDGGVIPGFKELNNLETLVINYLQRLLKDERMKQRELFLRTQTRYDSKDAIKIAQLF